MSGPTNAQKSEALVQHETYRRFKNAIEEMSVVSYTDLAIKDILPEVPAGEKKADLVVSAGKGLKDSKEIVQFGITKRPPKSRAAEHRSEGRKFTHMLVVGPAVTRETAETWEEDSLAAYRRSHRGKNPKYSKTSK